jgi:hypothetical protein
MSAEVFRDHVLQALVTELSKANALNRELLEVLRDVRDELAYAREDRRKRDEERAAHYASHNGAGATQ